jgi:hypothetical protein
MNLQAMYNHHFGDILVICNWQIESSINGEVIYENKRVGEWIKFWKASFITLFGLSPGFYIFEIY